MNNISHSRHEYSSRTWNRFRTTLLALVLVGGAGAFTWTQVNAREESNSPPVKITVNDKPAYRETDVTSFAPVVKKVTPSVVKVYVTGSVKNVAPMTGGDFDSSLAFHSVAMRSGSSGGHDSRHRHRHTGG